jgi:hypothetical protein
MYNELCANQSSCLNPFDLKYDQEVMGALIFEAKCKYSSYVIQSQQALVELLGDYNDHGCLLVNTLSYLESNCTTLGY